MNIDALKALFEDLLAKYGECAVAWTYESTGNLVNNEAKLEREIAEFRLRLDELLSPAANKERE